MLERHPGHSQRMASVDPTDARNDLLLLRTDGVDGGAARAPPEPLMRPEGTVVLARRTVLLSSIP
jgi:hypothetical protein